MKDIYKRLFEIEKKNNISEEKQAQLYALICKNEKENKHRPDRKEKNNQLICEYANDPEEFTFSFDVISDVHIDSTNRFTPYTYYFNEALEDLAYLNPNSQAFVMPGDLTNRGKEEEFSLFYQLLEEKQIKHPVVALGNHDVRWQENGEVYKTRYWQYNGPFMKKACEAKQLYWDTWIKDYHFIVLNTEKDLKDNAYLTKEQLVWFEQTLSCDSKKDKPIFVILHQAFQGTSDHIDLDRIYDPKQIEEKDPLKYFNSEQQLKKIMSTYKNIVIFTGHVHNAHNIVRVYHEPYGFVVDCPSFIRDDYGKKTSGGGYQVNVKGNLVQIRLRDFLNDCWVPQKTFEFFVG